MGSAWIAFADSTQIVLLYAYARCYLGAMDLMRQATAQSVKELLLMRLLKAIRDPRNRKALQWAGGGIVVVAGAIWFAITTYFPPDHANESAGSPTPAVEATGGSIASGRDTKIGGDANLGTGAGAERQ